MGPLIGGLITTAISWRVAFVFQAAIIVIILVLARSVTDPVPADPARPFDTVGAILALVTQNVQWLLLMGSSFVVSAYRQVVRHYNAIQTGVIFTAATVGILLSSLTAGRLAKRFQQRTLNISGFVTTIAGVLLLVAMVKGHPGA